MPLSRTVCNQVKVRKVTISNEIRTITFLKNDAAFQDNIFLTERSVTYLHVNLSLSDSVASFFESFLNVKPQALAD